MIGKLTGLVGDQGEDWVLIDVSGVGYEVHCPVRVLSGLPPAGSAATLFIETHVREDAIRLFGFASAEERAWFRVLQGVQGVGAKVAVAILSVLDTGDLADAIAFSDTARITQAQGVGPKVAQRITAELKDRKGLPPAGPSAPSARDGAAAQIGAGSSARADALSALVNLGYARADAASAIAEAAQTLGENSATEELIRLGLKDLSS